MKILIKNRQFIDKEMKNYRTNYHGTFYRYYSDINTPMKLR